MVAGAVLTRITEGAARSPKARGAIIAVSAMEGIHPACTASALAVSSLVPDGPLVAGAVWTAVRTWLTSCPPVAVGAGVASSRPEAHPPGLAIAATISSEGFPTGSVLPAVGARRAVFSIKAAATVVAESPVPPGGAAAGPGAFDSLIADSVGPAVRARLATLPKVTPQAGVATRASETRGADVTKGSVPPLFTNTKACAADSLIAGSMGTTLRAGLAIRSKVTRKARVTAITGETSGADIAKGPVPSRGASAEAGTSGVAFFPIVTHALGTAVGANVAGRTKIPIITGITNHVTGSDPAVMARTSPIPIHAI